MAEMGDTFRNRLKDGPADNVLVFPEPPVPMTECGECGTVLREDELFDGLCEPDALELRSDPRDEYTFQRDWAL